MVNKIIALMLLVQAIAIAICTVSVTLASVAYGVEAATVIMVAAIGATLCIASAVVAGKIAKL